MRKSRASLTAGKVARVLYFLTREDRFSRVLPKGWTELQERILERATRGFSFVRWVLGLGWYRRFLLWTDRRFYPGAFAHILLRKRYAHDQVEEALAGGVTQFVNIGAGYDPLGAFVANREKGTLVFEVDHPATQCKKRAALEEVPNLHFVPVDFSETNVEHALGAHCEFTRGERAVFVVEGVLMYLRESEVRALFDSLRTLSAPGSRVVFTFCGIDEQGRVTLGPFGRFTLFLARVIGEPIRWGIRRGELARFLEGLGWRLLDHPTEGDLIDRYLDYPQPPCDMEYVGMAESL